MCHRTARIVIGIAALVCFAGGTAIGVGLQQGSEGSDSAFEEPTIQPTTGADAASTPGATDAGGDGVATGEDPEAGSDAPDRRDDRDGDGRADEEGRADDDARNDEGEQAPPEGEERPPPRRNQPEIPDLELVPGALNPPVFVPPANNGNGNQPPPPPPPAAQPLSIHVVALGPGPVWENGWQRRCDGFAMRTNTFLTVSVLELPDAGPYRVTATARAGAATRNATVQQEPGQARRFTVAYGFPRGSVARPEYIEVTVTVTDADGNRATVRAGGRAGVGHRLYPADYCP